MCDRDHSPHHGAESVARSSPPLEENQIGFGPPQEVQNSSELQPALDIPSYDSNVVSRPGNLVSGELAPNDFVHVNGLLVQSGECAKQMR